ncbi:MAG: hypothetical protein M0031_03195 [Thermaerobacter sp.]|nr:hypothetical protein [Thermaerobacter sp.]
MRQAQWYKPRMPPLLLNDARPPRSASEYIELRGEGEAAWYALSTRKWWREVPEAPEWSARRTARGG